MNTQKVIFPVIRSTLSPSAVFVILLVISLIVRILIAISTHAFSVVPTGATLMVAKSLAATGEFQNPYAVPTGPTAHVAPLYPFLISILIRLMGLQRAQSALILLGIVFSSVLWSSMPFASKWFELPRSAGIFAGFLGALNPLPHYTELDGVWESVLAALLGMFFVTALYRRRDSLSFKTSILFGMAGGILVLIHTASLMVLISCSLWLLITRGPSMMRYVAPSLLVLLFVAMPWTVRNVKVMHGLFFVRDNYGLELAVSNYSGASATWVKNLDPQGHARHPDVTPEEALRMRAIGEVAYNHKRREEAVSWIKANPAEFLRLTALRAVYFWIPPRSNFLITTFEALITLFGMVGLILLFRNGYLDQALLIALVCLIYPLTYYPIQVIERYRYPIYWTLILSAGYCFSQIKGLFVPIEPN
jgi:hypothetical protein